MKRMMSIYCFVVFLLSSTNLYAQKLTHKMGKSVHTSQTGGRYEIVQSDIMRRHTFKLDKYTGEVYRFVMAKEGWFKWEKMYVRGLDTTVSDKINYQLFLGGIRVMDCFLLNINTGTTWILAREYHSGYGALLFKEF